MLLLFGGQRKLKFCPSPVAVVADRAVRSPQLRSKAASSFASLSLSLSLRLALPLPPSPVPEPSAPRNSCISLSLFEINGSQHNSLSLSLRLLPLLLLPPPSSLRRRLLLGPEQPVVVVVLGSLSRSLSLPVCVSSPDTANCRSFIVDEFKTTGWPEQQQQRRRCPVKADQNGIMRKRRRRRPIHTEQQATGPN